MQKEQLISLGQHAVSIAKKYGADVAEAVVSEGRHLSVEVRMGQIETMEEATSHSIGLRVMKGKKTAVCQSNDGSPAGLERLIKDVCEMVDHSEEDAFAGVPPFNELSTSDAHVDLQLYDVKVPSVEAKEGIALALAAEKAAFDHDKRITNSEGASFSRGEGSRALVSSEGFVGYSRGTSASIAMSAVVDDVDAKKRNASEWTAKRFFDELADPKSIGSKAAEKALAKLGAQKVNTQKAPVVFSPEMARSMISLLLSCINGSSVWRKSSYLAGKLGSTVASPLVTLVDDPLMVRGLGSRNFDGEGYLSKKNTFVEAGTLKSYVLDTYCAKRLDLRTTHSASRGSSGGVSPSTSNCMLVPGTASPESIIGDVKQGLYVTETMGFGFNALTGDFSRGAAGFWIENGTISFPVSELTISLNLHDLLLSIDAVGNDLDTRSSIMAPTFRVKEMTIAGK